MAKVEDKKDVKVAEVAKVAEVSAIETKEVVGAVEHTFADDTKHSFTAKQKIKRAISETDDNGEVTITFYFRSGKMLTYTSGKDDAVAGHLRGHGASQRIGDAGAGKDIDDAFLDCERVIKQLENGEWASKRSGGSGAGTTLAVLAFARTVKSAAPEKAEGMTDEEWVAHCKDEWLSRTDEQQAQISALSSYQIQLSGIRRERADARDAELAKKAADEAGDLGALLS